MASSPKAPCDKSGSKSSCISEYVMTCMRNCLRALNVSSKSGCSWTGLADLSMAWVVEDVAPCSKLFKSVSSGIMENSVLRALIKKGATITGNHGWPCPEQDHPGIADCRLQPFWLSRLTYFMQGKSLQVVEGDVERLAVIQDLHRTSED